MRIDGIFRAETFFGSSRTTCVKHNWTCAKSAGHLSGPLQKPKTCQACCATGNFGGAPAGGGGGYGQGQGAGYGTGYEAPAAAAAGGYSAHLLPCFPLLSKRTVMPGQRSRISLSAGLVLTSSSCACASMPRIRTYARSAGT